MRILELIRKDLSQIVRDWKSFVFLLAMPIVFTLFFGILLGSAGSDNRLAVGLVNLDLQGDLSLDLPQWVEETEVVRLDLLSDEASAQAQVRDNKLAAAIVIPPGYSQRVWQGENAPLILVGDPAGQNGQAALSAIQSAVKRMLGAVEAARLATAAVTGRQPFADWNQEQTFRWERFQAAKADWQNPPVDVTLGAASGSAPATPSGFAQSSPGILVQFAIFGLITSAMLLVVERKTRTLQRLLTTPITRWQIIAGHTLAMFVVVFLQELILVLLGQFAFGVNYLAAPAGTLLMMVSLAFWSAGLGLLIGATSRVEEQVILWSLLAMFLFSALGGAWFPLEVAGPTFSQIGHLMPTAWAMDGFQNIILRGLGDASALLPAGILLGVGLLFLTVAVWRFRFE
jgi:ABC-2 type transport system permease protein